MDYVVKLFIFIPFVTVVYFVIDFFIDLIKPYIASFPISGVLCQFGVVTGLNIFISVLVTGFFMKQILSFWR